MGTAEGRAVRRGGLQVEMAVFRLKDKLVGHETEAPAEPLNRPVPQRPDDVADLVRVLESLEPLAEDTPFRPRLGGAAAFWA